MWEPERTKPTFVQTSAVCPVCKKGLVRARVSSAAYVAQGNSPILEIPIELFCSSPAGACDWNPIKYAHFDVGVASA